MLSVHFASRWLQPIFMIGQSYDKDNIFDQLLQPSLRLDGSQ